MRRYTLKYEYSTDGLSWIDFSDIVDSAQTRLTHNLCTQGFKSAKDSVTFTIPSVTSAVKNQLIEDLLGTSDLHFRMTIPAPVQVNWGDDKVQWGSDDVYWDGATIGFVGYIDRSSVDLRSYPLPANLTLTAYDVSWLHLDDKVNQHILYENYTITQIVHALLGEAGLSYDASALDVADEVTIEAFVIDKDNSKTYREYIDTLLFEAGGYVLDFTPNGYARIFHLPWNDANGPYRTVDNPMNEGGVQIKSAYLKEDGVKMKWSSLAWSDADRQIWRDSINRKLDANNVMQGESIAAGAYWPKDAEVKPAYMEYSADFLDDPYLKLDTRKKNEDLSIIMAKNVYAEIYAEQNGSQYIFPVPGGYPIPADYQVAPYNFTTNPMIWPKKAWYLLYNTTASAINLTSFILRGTVLYRDRVNTLATDGSTNPKEYTSEYIYNASQAQRFLDFYWHFLQTSRFSMTWSEPYILEDLGDVVEITQKGMTYTQDAVIVAKTIRFVNDNTPIVQYSAVGVAVPVLSDGIAHSTVPQGSANNPTYEELTVEQKVEELEDDVVMWDFAIERTSAPQNLRMEWDSAKPKTYTEIKLTSLQKGTSVLEYWSCDGTKSADNLVWLTSFVGSYSKTTTGSAPVLRIYQQEPLKVINVTMYDPNDVNKTVTKQIVLEDQTEYDHDFGAFDPYVDNGVTYIAPDSFTVDGVEYDVLDGDFYVLGKNFFILNASSATPVSNPKEEGLYEELTGSSPKIYVTTDDTTIVSGKSYKKPTFPSNVFHNGTPYIFNNNSWNEMTATTANAKRMLTCLGNVLSDPDIQPVSAALYGWFENLVAKNAVLENLVAMFLQVGPGKGTAGSGFRFRALNDDGNGSPVFDVYYGDSSLFSVDISTGKIYFGNSFYYDPTYNGGAGAIRNTSDGVIIDSSGMITINNGLYKSNLVCPSFRSLPRSTPITPSTYTISGSANSQVSQMNNISLTVNTIYPCTHSTASTVRYLKKTSGPTYTF